MELKMTIRQQAILICQIGASHCSNPIENGYQCIGEAGDFDVAAINLALQAFWARPASWPLNPDPGPGRYWSVEADLFAQELLEAGWEPGEPVADYLD